MSKATNSCPHCRRTNTKVSTCAHCVHTYCTSCAAYVTQLQNGLLLMCQSCAQNDY